MTNKIVTAWITKYALTSGVKKVKAELSIGDSMICYRDSGETFDSYAHGGDWYLTPALALERAEKMRTDRIASLKKSIAKLEKMTFEVEP